MVLCLGNCQRSLIVHCNKSLLLGHDFNSVSDVEISEISFNSFFMSLVTESSARLYAFVTFSLRNFLCWSLSISFCPRRQSLWRTSYFSTFSFSLLWNWLFSLLNLTFSSIFETSSLNGLSSSTYGGVFRDFMLNLLFCRQSLLFAML